MLVYMTLYAKKDCFVQILNFELLVSVDSAHLAITWCKPLLDLIRQTGLTSCSAGVLCSRLNVSLEQALPRIIAPVILAGCGKQTPSSIKRHPLIIATLASSIKNKRHGTKYSRSEGMWTYLFTELHIGLLPKVLLFILFTDNNTLETTTLYSSIALHCCSIQHKQANALFIFLHVLVLQGWSKCRCR